MGALLKPREAIQDAPAVAPTQSPLFTAESMAAPKGLLAPGNIDLRKRKVLNNPDGSISTEASISTNIDGKEVLIPTVSIDGTKLLSNDEAVQQYIKTRQHLGMFDVPENADVYAQQLHLEQEKRYGKKVAPELEEVDPKTLQPLQPKATSLLKPRAAIQDTGLQNYQALGPPAPEQVEIPAPNEGIWNQLKSGLLGSVDPIARNVFNYIQGTSGTENAAPPLSELPGFEPPTRTEGGGYFENAPARIARVAGGLPTAIAEYALPTMTAAPLGPVAAPVGFAVTDATNAALTNRADVAMGRKPEESVAGAAAKGALLGTGFEGLKYLPIAPLLKAALGAIGISTVPPALEGRLPELEDIAMAPLGALGGMAKPPMKGAKGAPVADIPIDINRNQSRAFEAKTPFETSPPAFKAPLQRPEGQSASFESKGTPQGKRVELLPRAAIADAPVEAKAAPVVEAPPVKPVEAPVTPQQKLATAIEEMIDAKLGKTPVEPKPELSPTQPEGTSAATSASIETPPVVEGVKAPVFEHRFQQAKYDRLVSEGKQTEADAYAVERGNLPGTNRTSQNPVEPEVVATKQIPKTSSSEHSAIIYKDGSIYSDPVSNHGQIMNSIDNSGEQRSTNYVGRGWVWKGDKSTFISIQDVDAAGGDLHAAWRKKGVELETSEPQQTAKDLGLIYNGMQENPKGPSYHTFTDPQTKTTFLTPASDVASVQSALEAKRAEFNKPVPAPAEPLTVDKARELMSSIEGERDLAKLRSFAQTHGVEEKINWASPPDQIAHAMGSALSWKMVMDDIAKPKREGPAKASTGIADNLLYGAERVYDWTREQVVQVAKKLGIAVKGTTAKIRAAVGRELRRLATETSGSSLRPSKAFDEEPRRRRDNEDFMNLANDPDFQIAPHWTDKYTEDVSKSRKMAQDEPYSFEYPEGEMSVSKSAVKEAGKDDFVPRELPITERLNSEKKFDKLTDRQTRYLEGQYATVDNTRSKVRTSFDNLKKELKPELDREGLDAFIGASRKIYIRKAGHNIVPVEAAYKYAPESFRPTLQRLIQEGENLSAVEERINNAPIRAAQFDPQDFVDAVKRFVASPRTVGKKKPRGTLREEKLVESKKGQQSFLQELNDTLKAMDEGSMTLEEMTQLGISRLKNPEAVEKILSGKSKTLDDTVAANILVRGLVGDVFDVAVKASEGKVTAAELQAKADKAIAKIHNAAKLSTDAARAVRYQAVTWSPMQMLELAQKMRNEGKNLTKRQKEAIAKLLDEASAENVAQALNELKAPKFQDYILEYYYNNLLSGPQTITTNAISTLLWQHAQVPLRALEGGADMLQAAANTAAGKKYVRKTYASESIDMLRSMYMEGAPSGAKEAGRALRGLPTKYDSAVEMEIARASEAFARSKFKAVRAVAPAFSGASRLMRGADALLKGMAAGGEQAAIIKRWTLNEVKSTGMDYEAARAKIDRLLKSNTSDGLRLQAELKRSMEKFAQYATFNDAPNKVTQAILSLRNRTGITGRLILPFVNTVSNMTARSVEMTPVLGAAKEAIAHVPGIGKGNLVTPMGFNNIAAKQLAGATIVMSLAAMFDEDELTARGPKNPQEREAWLKEHQPYSIKINGEWYNYTRGLGPLGAPIASAAIWMETQKEFDRDDAKKALNDKTLEDEFNAIAANTATYFFESSWASSLYSTLGYGESITDAGKRQAARVASGMVFWNSAFRSVIGTAAEMEGDNPRRDADTFWEYFRAQSPVVEAFTSEVPGKLDVLGKEVQQQGGVWKYWLPMGVQTPSKDPVEVELARIAEATGMAPGWPSKDVDITFEDKGTLTETTYTMEKEMYRKFAQAVGADYNTELDKMFKSRAYKNAPTLEQTQAIGNLHAKITANNRAKMKSQIIDALVESGKVTKAKRHGVEFIKR